jgi:UDP-2,3-diacylglucosamine pyrophosphatase LpxH
MRSVADRPLLVVVSDIHLTDVLRGAAVPRAEAFDRFWSRIQAARGARPAILCFAGDLFDLVRSPRWMEGSARPYGDPDPRLVATVEAIARAILARESKFFDAIRKRVEEGALEIAYVLGNHDRLLRHAPRARRAIWRALTGRDEDVVFETERTFPEHRVLAYHGNVADPINHDPDGGATLGDAIGFDLITRFPPSVRRAIGGDHPELDDVDDVRPVFAVPAWVRQLGLRDPALLRPIGRTWTELVEGFLSEPFVRAWMKRGSRTAFFDTGTRLRLLLELSTTRVMAKGSDKRLTELYRILQHGFDGKMAHHAALEVQRRQEVRFVVNGHSHFASMSPLGRSQAGPAVYFNTGTWRSVHQIGHDLAGRPTFLPYDAMSYLVFFPDGDSLGRDFEWWTGALVTRQGEHAQHG